MGNLLCGNHHDDALLQAAFDGDLATMQRLLQQDGKANVNATNNQEQRTALHWASYCARLEMCQLLLVHGANVNAKESNGKTPFHWACYFFGQLELCRLLLDHGADLNAKDDDGLTPLHYACRDSGDLEVVQFLIDHGAEVNSKDNNGLTPLHLVCGNYLLADARMVRLLVDSGVDFNELGMEVHLPYVRCPKEQSDRMAPLHLACQIGHLEVVKLLLSRGAKVDGKTARGYTPLELASEQSHAEVVWCIVRQHPWLVCENET